MACKSTGSDSSYSGRGELRTKDEEADGFAFVYGFLGLVNFLADIVEKRRVPRWPRVYQLEMPASVFMTLTT